MSEKKEYELTRRLLVHATETMVIEATSKEEAMMLWREKDYDSAQGGVLGVDFDTGDTCEVLEETFEAYNFVEDEVETPCRSHYPDFDHYCHEKGQGCRREEVK